MSLVRPVQADSPVNTVLLDINGILTAVSVVLMFSLGPYADYGSWRPWVLISESSNA